MKKPRKKKYNPNKSYDVVASRCLRNVGLVYIGGNDHDCYPFDMSSGTKIDRMEPSMFRAIFGARLQWTYKLLVFCRDQTGQEYHAEMEVTAPMPVRHEQMLNSLKHEHDQLIKSVNPLHFVNIGYVALPKDIEFSPVICRQIYDQMGAYEPLSQWEAEQQQKQQGDCDDRTRKEDTRSPALCD